ncbi:Bcr/CflA family efflux MFS transporter [Aliihoeflea aestuarii]|jgi:MFS transporter, DHA1 family, multidrug resistance protein|uniref:multidrug effflux MFS transporter n=1 Tax=Aliihoeflea aestuarii TaxID=453840 RepID=UPI0020922F73|nr:multidrug effflux MFS transporter [Aliihoeflea aestuarii]MCO6391270.1 Bcr/CflA family efflux MFS transporter [Aliihoeflea aestuarii]
MNVQTTQPVAPAPVMSELRVSIIGAMLVAIGPISMALFTPAMPEIVNAFGTTDAAVAMTLSLYFAGFAFAQLVCGPLSDGYGRKPVTIAFMGIYLVATVAAILAPTIELLIASRFIQGVGAAVGVAIARAIVRDLFTSERSARIMNLIGMILGIGPALSPTIGGVATELFGWHSIFAFMLLFGVAIILMVKFAMTETVVRDPSRIKPRALLRSYRALATSGYFMWSSLVLGGSVGALYTLATLLPFVLMDRVGLTPTQFGIGMLMQSGAFFLGSVVMRRLMGRHSAYRLVRPGLWFIAVGSLLLFVGLHIVEPSFLWVMGPVGVYAFGIAFVMPAMSTAALAPYPHMAGAAASLSGFLQMGGGLAGGVIAALVGDPITGISTVIPGMGFFAILSWYLWSRYPEPALARTVITQPPVPPAE